MDAVRRTLVLVLVVVAIAPACGARHTGGGDDTAAPDAGTANLASLAVSPDLAQVALAPAALGFTGVQAFHVTATYVDGTSADVTSLASLSADADSGITFAGAAGLATATIAGHYTITAKLAGAQATAELDASLTGESIGSDVSSTDASGLDGSASAAEVPTIAYPPAGALFPINVTPLEVHAQKSDPSQTVARVTFTSGDSLAYSYYATCAASPNPATFANACIVQIGGAFATQLAGVSETADVQITVRLAGPAGSVLGESAPIAAAWAKTPLSGGLYYWTTAGTGDTTFNTAIARYDFDGDASTPAIYLSSADAPAVPQGQTQCIGCHAVSPDGSKLAFSLGGSLTGYYSLYDVAKVTATATNMTEFAGMSTFSPDASRLVTMSYGVLTLRAADATLAAEGQPLFPEVTEEKSHPFWGPSGEHVAFVSWTPSQADISSGHVTGDMVQGGQIWLAPSDGQSITGQASLLVPRATGITSYYPSISDDDNLVVFNQSSCSGPPNTAGSWGAGPCDGYNDISATLQLVPSAGGTPIALTNANGGDDPLTTNSWPRWSPDHGLFRGKRLYWVAFSSRRPYGLALPGLVGADTTKPQLWFAAIAVDDAGAVPTSDPSFAAVWLPGQDPSMVGPRGNHTPAWTSHAVPIE